MTPRSQSKSGQQADGPSAVMVGGGIAVALLLAVGWYLWSRDDRFGETLELQKRVLAEDLSPRQQQRAIDLIIRNVDTMSRDEVQEIRQAMLADLRQVHERGIDAYFQAPVAEKQAVLDKALDREAVLAELRFAVGNNSFGGRRRRPPPKPPADTPAAEPLSESEKQLAAARRDLAKKYFEALAARAKQRGIQLSARR